MFAEISQPANRPYEHRSHFTPAALSAGAFYEWRLIVSAIITVVAIIIIVVR